MKSASRFLLVTLLLVFLTGCAYRYYLGMHGPSIRQHPEVHKGATKDQQCLKCHDPKLKDAQGPPTTHPQFTGCIKCHNDAVAVNK